MLDFFRRQRSRLKWIWFILIFIFSVTLVTLYIPVGDLGTVSISTDVAEVGNQVVTSREFLLAYQSYLNQIRSQISPELIRRFGFEQRILDGLVTRHVMLAEAERLGLSVTRDEIERKIIESPVFTENGAFVGLTRYGDILAARNLTIEDFESAMSDEILIAKLTNVITAGVTLTDKEAEDEYRRRNEKVKLDYFIVEGTKFEDEVEVTDAEQREYFEKNKARYSVPEQRQARYIFVDVAKMEPGVAVTEEELAGYYESNRAEYTMPERVRAQHILFKTQGETPGEAEAIRDRARGALERAKGGTTLESWHGNTPRTPPHSLEAI